MPLPEPDPREIERGLIELERFVRESAPAVDVRTRRGTAVLSGELGDPARVAALVGAEADVAGLVAERFRVTPVRRR